MDQFPNPQPIDPETNRFNQLERVLETFQENVRHIGIIASDFCSKSQKPLDEKIHTLISGLQELDSIRNNFQEVRIPIELLTEVLDAGKNPTLYTKEVLERTQEQNKIANGKVEILRKFHATLLRDLAQYCPEDAKRYCEARSINPKPSQPHS